MSQEPMHTKDDCKGYCPFHKPSNHKMSSWPINVRYDRGGLTERICGHGIGHPDPDSLDWMNNVGRIDDGVHGCDGCCGELMSQEQSEQLERMRNVSERIDLALNLERDDSFMEFKPSDIQLFISALDNLDSQLTALREENEKLKCHKNPHFHAVGTPQFKDGYPCHCSDGSGFDDELVSSLKQKLSESMEALREISADLEASKDCLSKIKGEA